MKNYAAENVSKPLMTLLVLFFVLLTGFYLMPPNGSIRGKITAQADGKELPFVALSLKDKNKIIIAQETSDVNGDYYFKNILPGIYICEATLQGYQKKTDTKVVVNPGKTTVMNIQLASSVHLKSVEIITTPENHLSAKDKKYKESNHPVSGVLDEEIRGNATNQGYRDQVNTQEFNREGYDYLPENEFKPAFEIPLSTFSIDVDRASYANVRRFLTQGTMPPVDAVRVEEMINYFSYDYPQPKDEHPFSINTEVMTCPWNKTHQLALIGLQGKKIAREHLPPSSIVFLIDVSGSMATANKLPLLKKSLELLVNGLRDADRVAIVVYAGNSGLVLPATSGKNKETIMEAINRLEAGGSTAGGAGITLAYKVAHENFIEEGNNRVILATDGDFNVGISSDGELVRLIEEKRKEGVYLTVLGFGTGNYQDAKMEKLADKGNGNYAYIDNIMEAQKTLVNEMGGTLLTIAKDVKLQVEFNPAQVKEYKLIGYENRLLYDHDFNDDTKDAGELGSGHTVTALYEIIPASGSSTGVTVDPLKYQLKNPAYNHKQNNELLTVKFRYKNPDADKSKLMIHVVSNETNTIAGASENIRFAASVAAFGMLLRNSKFKGDSGYAMVLKLAEGAKGKDTNGYRGEFIRLAETAQVLDKATAGE